MNLKMTTTREERIKEFEKMLRKAPERMSPLKVSRCSPFGKNRVYEMIHTGELKAYVYQETYIIAKKTSSNISPTIARKHPNEPSL